MNVHLIKPIVVPQRGSDLNSRWITKKVAKFSNRDDFRLRGNAEIQVLQGIRFRLHFTNIGLRTGNAKANKSGDEWRQKYFLYLLYDISSKGMSGLTKSTHNVRVKSCIDLRDVMEQKTNSSFDFPLQQTINGIAVSDVVGFAIISPKTVLYPERVHAYGEFLAKIPDAVHDISEKRGAFSKSSSRCQFVAVKTLMTDTPLSCELSDRYSAVTKKVFEAFEKTETDVLSYDSFKVGLKLANVIVLESRARCLFNACIEKDGENILSATGFEIALMINDSYPANTHAWSLYEMFFSFDYYQSGSLNYEQFLECVHALAFEANSFPLEKDKLSYLFKKVAKKGKINFTTFALLWCRRIASAENELFRRGLIRKKRLLRWMFLSKYKRILFNEVTRQEEQIISTFTSCKDEIIKKRKDLQSSTDNKKRLTRAFAKRQNRIAVVEESSERRHKRNLIQRENEKQSKMEFNHDALRKKIYDQNERFHLRKQDEYEKARNEKKALEEKELIDVAGDRIILQNRNLGELPPVLYSNNASRVKLVDVKFVDLSGNCLKLIPGLHFMFQLTLLRKLSLSRNQLKNLPVEIAVAKNLEILHLDNNKFTGLPTQIKELVELKVLDISKNKIEQIQQSVCQLEQLRVLIAHSNLISTINESVSSLKSLEVLDLSNNSICNIPESFCLLTNLFSAKVANNALSDLPFRFGKLFNLEVFDASFNYIHALPESMRDLKKLTIFNLEENNISSIDKFSHGWENVQSLDCRKNHISYISQHIGSLKSLSRLSFSMNKIKELPPEIGLLKNVVHMNLQSNCLRFVPVEIGALISLQSIDLSHNQIIRLPHQICLLPRLVWMNVSHNGMKELPACIGSLSNLRTVKASHNELEGLPPSFNTLLELRDLDISSNRICSMDKDTCIGLQALENANYSSNIIKLLPRELLMMRSLRQLNLRHNRLQALPLGFSCFVNAFGQRVKVDVCRNPFCNVPFKFRSAQNSRNPSSSMDELLEWMKQEEVFYEVAVSEWSLRSYSYLACELNFNDFYQRVLQQVEVEQSSSASKDRDLRSKFFMDRIKRFYFESKKRGSPPIYEQESNDEEERREAKAQSLEIMRNELAKAAKEQDIRITSETHDAYFNSFESRCRNASSRFIEGEMSKMAALRQFNSALLSHISKRVHIKEMAEAECRDLLRDKVSQEVEMLNKISFQNHFNRKRSFPVDLDPCWKRPDDR